MHVRRSTQTQRIVVTRSHITELAIFARNWVPQPTIHNIYPTENTLVQIALNRNMISLTTYSNECDSQNQRLNQTYNEWYRSLGHVLCSFPAPIRKAASPISDIADNVIIANKIG